MGYANTAANPGAPVRVSFALPTLPLQQQQQSKSAKASASAIPNGSLGSTSTASSSTGSDDQVSDRLKQVCVIVSFSLLSSDSCFLFTSVYVVGSSISSITVTLPSQTHKNGSEVWSGEKIAFNYGREIFVYPYKGVKKAADLTKPIDKRIYKVTDKSSNLNIAE